MPTPYEKLVEQETRFLLAAGWTKVDGGWLEPPCEPDPRVLEHGHAFNSEWMHGRERGTHTRSERYVMHTLREVYLLESGWEVQRGDDVAEGRLPDEWTEPSGRHKQPYVYRRLDRAVNSQKQWDRVTLRFAGEKTP